ncbi:MAG TPA: amidohydrolase [Gemmatimonadaceae bacterium]|nr:amidohydrolase [Gemmatimonadaceae bacterium]
MTARLSPAVCVAWCVTALLMGAHPSPRSASAAPPDLILTGGKIFTADSTHPWAEAIAIRGERIVAVGTNADVHRLGQGATREIALHGRVVIPGINDAHDHLGDVPVGVDVRTSAEPTPDPGAVQVIDSIRAVAARVPAGTWIKVTIGLSVLSDTTVRRAVLDRVAAGRPVLLWTWWGHGAILNTAGLRALGIDESAADPLGGWYERDVSGRLTGAMYEYAEWSALRRLYSTGSERALVDGLRAYADSAILLGVTTVQDMAGLVTPTLTVRAFRDADLPMRVRLIRWSNPNASGRNEAEWDTVPARVSPWVVVSGRKWVLDATPIEENALMRRPYPGRPGWYGRLNFPLDTIRAMLRDALRPGAAQLALHIVGDSTGALVIDAMEALAPDSVWRPLRVRFEHGGGIAGAQIARARRLGIIISQPRPEGAPLRSWLEAGLTVAYGSDMLRNPYYHLMIAVTEPTAPDQAISREAAVTILTRGSAYAEFAEHEKGTLAPGMLADLAVLSQDVFTVPAAALPATTSVLTIVGGRIVHDQLSHTTSTGVSEH